MIWDTRTYLTGPRAVTSGNMWLSRLRGAGRPDVFETTRADASQATARTFELRSTRSRSAC